MFIIRFLAKTRAVSVLVVLLTSASLITLYFYLVSGTTRDPILLMTISVFIGGLAYAVLDPA